MIVVDAKSDAKASSPLSLKAPQDESDLSFSQLLKGIVTKDKPANNKLTLALDDEKTAKTTSKTAPKKETLLRLLKGQKSSDSEAKTKITSEQKEPLELNPKISQNMSPKELKVLVADAKEYLKSKILQSDEYKRSQVKDLPKSLKGLADMAKKFGLDPSKITLEELRAKPTTKESSLDLKSSKRSSSLGEQKAQTKNIEHDKKLDLKSSNNIADTAKKTPLFKAQDIKEHTTQQMVATKQIRVEQKTPKEKADETLKLLLQGDKAKESKGLTADFSVATARVIAPAATSEVARNIEKLLHGEASSSSEQNSSSSKLDGLALKGDSLEVKVNEAKQMIKYLSQDVKSAIEDYKPPFTRVKFQLNPQKLGEVDLTVVQRGKNLHVNLSSNSAAINTLSMNANELRAQLNSSGINNASLNFNNSSGGEQSANGQQNRQNEKRANKEYAYFENEDKNEEILSSLEIVVPYYA